MNDLIFDFDHQLDKLRIFKTEVDEALKKFASKRYTIILADLFKTDLDPLLVGGEYEFTMLQDQYRQPDRPIEESKQKVLDLLKMLGTHTEEIVNEFAQSNDYAPIQNKWKGYITIDCMNLLYKNPWDKVIKYDLKLSVKSYLIMIGERFGFGPVSLGI